MGRTMYDIARESIQYNTEFTIKGFIDDNIHALDCFENYPPLLDTISEYRPQDKDVFVCSIGGRLRKACIESLLSRGGKFQTVIHHTARILTNAFIGEGTVIGSFTTIGNDAKIGKYNMIQSYSIVGHDCIIGDFNRIDTHVTMVGGTELKDECDIHTNAVINHGVKCESGSIVAALSFVIRNVKAGTTVMGNPAKTFKL